MMSYAQSDSAKRTELLGKPTIAQVASSHLHADAMALSIGTRTEMANTDW